jgi:PAS domain S-box-containing protein
MEFPQGNSMFQQLAESITDIFFAFDNDLNFTYWNKASEELTGISSNDAVGKHLFDLFPKARHTVVNEVYSRVLKTRVPETFINEFQVNGSKLVFNINVYPLSSGISVLAKEITHFFNSELSIRKSEDLFRSTLDNMLEGCAIFDHQWNYLYMNKVHAKHALLDKETAIGKNLLEVVPGFEKSDFFHAYQLTMKERIPQQVENSFTFIDGTTHWYEARTIPVPDGLFLLTIEITERKNYEQELIRHQTILTQAERMAHLGAWWIDLNDLENINSNNLKWSEEVYHIFGFEPYSVEVTNELFFNCVHPDDRERLKKEVAKAIEENVPYEAEHRIIRPDGTERIVKEHAVVRQNNDGKPECIMGAVQDITDFKKSLEERNKLFSDLQQETKTLRTIITSVPDEIWVFDREGELLFVNPAVINGLGFDDTDNFKIETFLSKLDIRTLDGTVREPNTSVLKQSLKGETVSGDEMVRHLKTGEFRYRHYHSAPMKDSKGDVFGVVIVVNDITERRKTEEKIKELLILSQRRSAELNTIIESIPDALFIGTKAGMTHVNKKGLELFGEETLESMKERIGELAIKFNVRWPDTGEPLREEELQFARALSGETITEEVLATNLKTGKDIYLRVAAAPVIENGEVIAAVAVDSDITEMKIKEETIKASLSEKEVLLKELYHRTKNNMQVISSLLGLKAADVDDEKTTAILEDMKNRIQAIALVHQKLYQSKNLSRVNVREYITDLIDLLKASHLVNQTRIKFKLELDEISVLIDTAVPCGLIINELISNSLKYAFPDKKDGTISIRFKRIEGDLIELQVSDNGIGLRSSDIEGRYNLGLKLFHIIAEDQLQAETSMDNSDGLKWTIRFKDILYDERI